MPTPRIYYPDEIILGRLVTLSSTRSHYLVNVLRVQTKQSITLFNGNGGEYHSVVVNVTRKQVQLRAEEFYPKSVESPINIELAQSISRGERMDFVMQKAVELGVTSITPLFTERCEVKLNSQRLQKRLEHWQNIVIGAAEQSGRCKLPKLHSPLSLNHWLAIPKTGTTLVCDPLSKKLLSAIKTSDSAHLLLGPEGGLTIQEVHAANTAGFTSLSLGPRILRTETAALAALALLQTKWGDMS